MAKKAQFTAALPKLAVTPEMRDRIQRAADKAEISMADVVRDCIIATLPLIELDLGLVDLVEVEEPEEPVRENRAAGCAWGPPLPG